MRLFRWFSVGPIPTAYDLRRLGWKLLVDEQSSGRAVAHAQLGRLYNLPMPQWLSLAGANRTQRKWMMMIDVPESQVRERVLHLGFGDAVGHGPSLDEVESRVLRLLQYAEALPRYRLHGAVRLDLLARDAFVVGRAVGLHPRGFALLWRRTEHPGETVGTPKLLYDVWRLSFRPETHSLAVHLSRLRTKLRTAGVDGLVEPCPGATTCCAARTGKPPPRLRPNSHWTITPVCARSRSQHWPECRITQHGLDRYPAGSRSHRHR